jgi:hypothetical protein
MGVETVVGPTEQFAIEALFTAPGFVARDQEDTLAPRIEGKGYLHSPSAALNRNSFIFAWREPFSVSDARSPQLRPELLEQAGQSQNLRPYVFVQREELRSEFIADLNAPAHPVI